MAEQSDRTFGDLVRVCTELTPHDLKHELFVIRHVLGLHSSQESAPRFHFPQVDESF